VILQDKKGKEKTVEEMKIKFMANVTEGLNSLELATAEKGLKFTICLLLWSLCFLSAAFLKKFLEKVKSMGHLDSPDYKALNKMMTTTLKEIGVKENSPLIFTASKTSPRGAGSRAKTSKRPIQESEESEEEVEEEPPKKRGKASESKLAKYWVSLIMNTLMLKFVKITRNH
jgi:hypothetical protein